MGLRCLLGHDFDEPETERERNEEGNEVVVTVREVKTCKRCGEKQVVSENKEITSIDQLRQSATGEPAGSSSQPASDAGNAATADSPGDSAADQWSADELSTDRDDAGTAGSRPEPDEAAAESESAEPESAPAQDPIDRGVADIIEQAEKDDDMLASEAAESEPDAQSEQTDEDDDVPVHPGQRGPDDDEEAPDAESDDGVILDDGDDARPEDARRQWEEEASPEEVPGDDLNVGEPVSPDGEDAEIIDAGPENNATPEPANEPESQPSSTASVAEDEDAEILDAGPEPSESPEPTNEPEPEPTSEPEPEREETEDGHMPWPAAPGEDEGHDATVPDGEPADIDFGGGITPSDADRDQPAATRESTAHSEPESDPEPEPETEPASEPDRANGHRDEQGDSTAADAPTATVDLEQSSRDAGRQYVCPECGLTRDVGNSSMRAGDICPECRKGYITEQQKAE
ncbi:hypothetical protein JCM30237_15880 [Halolamina litorea]|uniref:Oxidoreductase n=1 Tax=Halolamina litorea TaxID=1515593 RepID=A0ABD6BNF0_9EURY|nr:hypothetical protein [Halolamina litorea]